MSRPQSNRLSLARLMRPAPPLAAQLALLLGLALWAPPGRAAPAAANPPAPPAPTTAKAPAAAQPLAKVAVMGFHDRRRGGAHTWMGEFLRQALVERLEAGQRALVLDRWLTDTWERHLERRQGIKGLLVAPKALQQMGAEYLIRGELQQVITQLQITVRLYTPKAPGPVQTLTLRVNLATQNPEQTAQELAALLDKQLPSRGGAAPAPWPSRWEPVERFYSLEWPDLAQAAAVNQAVAARSVWMEEPGLKGRAAAQAALLTLVAGQRHTPDPGELDTLLLNGLKSADAALEEAPWDSQLLALKAEILFFLKRDEEALAHTRAVLERWPDEPLALAVEGLANGLSSGRGGERMAQAVKANPFFLAINRPPKTPPFQGGVLDPFMERYGKSGATPQGRADEKYDAMMVRAERLFGQKQYKEAAELLSRAKAMEGADHRPGLLLARVYLENGQYPEAAEDLKGLAAEYPEEPEIFYLLGQAHSHTGNFEGAEEAFSQALDALEDERDVLHPRILLERALAQGEQRKWSQAEAGLAELVDKYPSHAEGWLRLGIARYKLGDTKGANQAFNQRLALLPGDKEALAWLDKMKTGQNREKPTAMRGV